MFVSVFLPSIRYHAFRRAAGTLGACMLVLTLAWPLEDSKADEIYRWTDAQGNVQYSTTPQHPQQAPAALPEVGKENLSKKIQQIKAETPPNCEKHGGEDCNKGPDTDGSVVCLDGFADSVLPFRFHCVEVRLSTELIVLFDSEPKAVKLAKAFDQPIGKRKVVGFRMPVRNLSAVEARNISSSVEFEILGYKKRLIPASGPDKIEAFGFADYNAEIDLGAQGLTLKDLETARPRIRCDNCSAVVNEKRP